MMIGQGAMSHRWRSDFTISDAAAELKARAPFGDSSTASLNEHIVGRSILVGAFAQREYCQLNRMHYRALRHIQGRSRPSGVRAQQLTINPGHSAEFLQAGATGAITLLKKKPQLLRVDRMALAPAKPPGRRRRHPADVSSGRGIGLYLAHPHGWWVAGFGVH